MPLLNWAGYVVRRLSPSLRAVATYNPCVVEQIPRCTTGVRLWLLTLTSGLFWLCVWCRLGARPSGAARWGGALVMTRYMALSSSVFEYKKISYCLPRLVFEYEKISYRWPRLVRDFCGM